MELNSALQSGGGGGRGSGAAHASTPGKFKFEEPQNAISDIPVDD